MLLKWRLTCHTMSLRGRSLFDTGFLERLANLRERLQKWLKCCLSLAQPYSFACFLQLSAPPLPLPGGKNTPCVLTLLSQMQAESHHRPAVGVGSLSEGDTRSGTGSPQSLQLIDFQRPRHVSQSGQSQPSCLADHPEAKNLWTINSALSVAEVLRWFFMRRYCGVN